LKNKKLDINQRVRYLVEMDAFTIDVNFLGEFLRCSVENDFTFTVWLYFI